MRSKQRIAWTTLALLALLLVFFLYTRADFMVQLSNQLWACF